MHIPFFHLFDSISNHVTSIYIGAFFSAFLESLAFVGIFIPGATIVLFLGFLIWKGTISFPLTVLIVALGAILGDSISYYMGTKGTRFFKYESKLLKKAHIDRGEAYFKKHGPISILTARFVGPLRAIIPFVAGLTKMDKRQFLVWNVGSGIAFSFVYLSIGYISGRAWVIVAQRLENIFLLISAVVTVATFYFIYRYLRKS